MPFLNLTFINLELTSTEKQHDASHAAVARADLDMGTR